MLCETDQMMYDKLLSIIQKSKCIEIVSHRVKCFRYWHRLVEGRTAPLSHTRNVRVSVWGCATRPNALFQRIGIGF